MKKLLTFLAVGVFVASPAFAQLVEPNQIGARMGHMHLAVRDVDAQKQFQTSVLGGTVVKKGPLELSQFPGVYVMLRKPYDPPPSAEGTVNHFGFVERDMKAALARWKAASVKIEPTENPNEVYGDAPDALRIDLYGEPAIPTDVSMNHIHFFASD